MSEPKQPKYVVIITNAAGEDIEIEKFLSLKYGDALNTGSIAEMVCALGDNKMIGLNTATINSWAKIYRWDDPDDPTTERIVFYGKLVRCKSDMDDISGKVTLLYYNLAALLTFRAVDYDYSVTSPTDASDILWDLIDITQSKTATVDAIVYNVGDLGITRGEHPTSKNRQPETDLRSKTVLESLIAFSEYIDGIDWEISPTPTNNSIGVFNTFFRGAGELYHKANDVVVPLQYYIDDTGASRDNNCASVSITEDGTEYSNSVTYIGAAIEDVQISSLAEDFAQQAAFGLFEKNIQETSISEQATLDDAASEALNSMAVIPFDLNVTLMSHVEPRVGTYSAGDIFTMRFKWYDFKNFEKRYRLYKMTVAVDSVGVETVTLELNNI